MPVITQFYGLIVKMYFQQCEHMPPHIHVQYAEYSASISIEDLIVLDGKLPKKALSMIREWISLHKNELLKMWKTQKFKKLPGLE